MRCTGPRLAAAECKKRASLDQRLFGMVGISRIFQNVYFTASCN